MDIYELLFGQMMPFANLEESKRGTDLNEDFRRWQAEKQFGESRASRASNEALTREQMALQERLASKQNAGQTTRTMMQQAGETQRLIRNLKAQLGQTFGTQGFQWRR